MSNAMRMGKRSLAGVAAGALAAALLPFVAVGTANAAVSAVTPGGPLRAANIATNASSDDTRTLTNLTTAGLGQSFVFDDSVKYINLVSGPGIDVPTGTVYKLLDNGTVQTGNQTGGGAVIGTALSVNSTGNLAGDDSLAVVTDALGDVVVSKANTAGFVYADGGAPVAAGTLLRASVFLTNTEVSETVKLWLNAPGTYVFTVGDAAATEYTWTVTTTGAPTAVKNDPLARDMPNVAGQTSTITFSAIDANGANTQLIGSETVTLTSADDSLYVSVPGSGTTLTTLTFDDDSLASGKATVTFTIAGGGSGVAATTVTGAGGALLSSITKSITAVTFTSTAATTAMTLTAPANAFDTEAGTGTAGLPSSWQVPTGTTLMTVQSTLSATATSDKVFYQAYIDDTTSANLLGSKMETAASGKTTYSFSVAPTQAAANRVYYVTDGTKWIKITQSNASALFEVIPDASVRAAAFGGTTEWTVAAGTQFGSALAGYTVTLTTSAASRNASKTVTATTDASGLATVALPDTSTSATNLTDAVTITVKLGTASATLADGSTSFTTTVKYSATGDVALTAMKFNGTAVASFTAKPTVPYQGTASASTTGDDTELVEVTVTASVPGTPVTFTGSSDSVKFVDTDAAISVTSTDLETSLEVASNATTGVATAYFLSTKTGANTVTATSSSGATATGSLTYQSAAAAARFITVVADPVKQTVGVPAEITVTVKDVFDNPAPLNASNYVTLATNLGTLAGGANIWNVTATDASGKAIVSLTAGVTGKATIAATSTGGQFANKVDVPFIGAAAGVGTGSAEVEFSGSPVAKSISIAGSRTTVSGRPGIVIDGVTTGIENGKTVIPYFRFPGQSEYTQGSARPVVNDGEFTWQRKTGKKFYAYVTNDDGAVKSNRVIIQAK